MPGQFLAYAFQSDLSLEQMIEKLNEAVPWNWRMRDSDLYPDYISTQPFRRLSKYRIFQEENRYVFDIFYDYKDPGAEGSWESQHRLIKEELLPAVGARDIEETENYG